MPHAKALDKTKLRREIERDRREAAGARLRELRDLILEARQHRDERIKEIRLDCAQKRAELRESCALRRTRARTQGGAEVAERKKSLRESKRYERDLRGGKPKGTVRTTRAERARENDDAVRANLAPELVPVFNAVRKAIRGSERVSRTEAFLQWAHDNPDQVFEIQNRHAERDVDRLIAEYQRTEHELGRRGARQALAAVPF